MNYCHLSIFMQCVSHGLTLLYKYRFQHQCEHLSSQVAVYLCANIWHAEKNHKQAMPQLTDRSKLPNIVDPVIRDTMDPKHLYQVLLWSPANVLYFRYNYLSSYFDCCSVLLCRLQQWLSYVCNQNRVTDRSSLMFSTPLFLWCPWSLAEHWGLQSHLPQT